MYIRWLRLQVSQKVVVFLSVHVCEMGWREQLEHRVPYKFFLE